MSSLFSAFFASSVFSSRESRRSEESLERLRSSASHDPVKLRQRTTPRSLLLNRFPSAAHSFLLDFARSMIWNRQALKFDFDNMFKRSFGTKDGRVSKSRPIKTTFREHARMKMQDSLDSPPVGRWCSPFLCGNGPMLMVSQYSHKPYNHNGCGS